MRWARVQYLNVTDCLPGKHRCTRVCNFIYRVQFHFFLGLTWGQLVLAIGGVTLIFTIFFALLFLIADTNYFVDNSDAAMGG